MWRTTLLLDDETRAAARQLARKYGCSVSEAIRRAVIQQRDQVVGMTAARRAERTRALRRAYEVFADNDPAAEVRELKAQDPWFFGS